MAHLILITGGSRSGKSAHALAVAEKLGKERLFIATCPKIDREMAERVERHQEERRGRNWTTVECEIELASLFPAQVAGFDVVVIDCITLWVNNVLFSHNQSGVALNDTRIGQECSTWLDRITAYSGAVICVTNEVGLGVVPDNPMARKYRDLVGTCNQIIGKMADEVIFVSCGIPFHLKRKHNRNQE